MVMTGCIFPVYSPGGAALFDFVDVYNISTLGTGVRCRLAYGPADTTATHCLLLQ